jgi:hypothetical protein
MADTDQVKAKIDIKVGNLSFSAEGDQAWLGEQLTKVLKAATPAIAQADHADGSRTGDAENAETTAPFNTSLAAYIKSKSGETNQVQRFLATSGWLFHRGNQNLTTTMVAKALADHHQKRLGNPADCLNKNCAKGFCEKQKDHFFITPDGWSALGERQ